MNNMTALAAINQSDVIDYPESDGTPMGETEIHIQALMDALLSLKDFFLHQPDIYIAGNMFLYYEEGNPEAVEAPDLFVVKGVDKERRRTFQLWKEKAVPCFILEFTSKSSRVNDQVHKKSVYEMLGVQEYFLFDPEEEYLKPSLQGYRLTDTGYERLEADKDGSLISRELGLRLQRESQQLRMSDLVTRDKVLNHSENVEARRIEAEARQKAEEAQKKAEEARQKAEEARRQEEKARWKAEEDLRQEAEARRQEAEARQKAEAELERLKAELEKLRGKG